MRFSNLIHLICAICCFSALAQERRSILDDPDFLKNLGDVSEPQTLGTPPCVSCDAHQESTRSDQVAPFLRERRLGLTFPISHSIPGASCVSERRYIQNSGDPGIPGGATICMNSGNRSRHLEFRAIDGSREGAMMYFSENISHLDSQNHKTAVLMLPRRGIPSVRKVGSELHLRLSTGELVVLDAATKAHKRGPLSFGPIGTTPRPTPFTYTGSAIVLSASNNYKMPFEEGGAAQVNVKQNGRSCSIPRTRLWNPAGNPIAGTDQAMVTAINTHCVPRPSQPFTLD